MIEEKWITEAKERAKEEAEQFVENMQYIAELEDIDEEWFIEEVVKNIHKIQKENLTPTQTKVKRARRIVYSGDNKNMDPELARDIITLYVGFGLGYSPIRHIVGYANDKRIEDVIRQHMFGRSGVDGSIGELTCPASPTLDEVSTKFIMNLASKYETLNDDYVDTMLKTGRWKDDPVTSTYNNCECGYEMDKEWTFCPNCGKRRKKPKLKKIANI